MTGLTPGAGNRSTPNRHGIRCRKSVIARAPSPSPSPAPTVRTLRVHPRPFAGLPFPSTNGANHPSLGYSPRNSHIETVQGLKARPIRSRHPPGHDTGPSALRPSAPPRANLSIPPQETGQRPTAISSSPIQMKQGDLRPHVESHAQQISDAATDIHRPPAGKVELP